MTVAILGQASACVAPYQRVEVVVDPPAAAPDMEIGLQVDGSERIDWDARSKVVHEMDSKGRVKVIYQIPSGKGYLVTAMAPGYRPQQARRASKPPHETLIDYGLTAVALCGAALGLGAGTGWLVDKQIPQSRGVGVTTGLLLAAPVVLGLWTILPFVINAPTSVNMTLAPELRPATGSDSVAAPKPGPSTRP